MEWAPTWAPASKPSWPHVGYGIDTWAKLNLGFWADCWVVSGSQLGPSQQAQLGPKSNIVWMFGLNWARVSGLFTGYGVGPDWAPAK